MSNNNLDNIKHIVVLMMENRSFDNVLGWLYNPDNKSPFNKTPKGTYNGVNKDMSNPTPEGGLAYVQRGTDFTAPYPDPNEPYESVYRQMYNIPPNTDAPSLPISNTEATPPMTGFVNDYQNAIDTANEKLRKDGKPVFDVNADIIMDCFAPSSLPVINGLAQSFAVCDNWFSSVPTQTFPNRSFIHAATSSGNVYNTWKTGKKVWDVGVFINDTKTIFNLLEDNDIYWKVYYGGSHLLCNTLLIQEKLWKYGLTKRFSPYSKKSLFNHETFTHDIENDNLPAYSFIEPNMLCSEKYGAENDMHPAYAVMDRGSPTDVRYGDKLIYDIYMALRKSHYWDKTLFVITFDEHGGCFDHIPTPPPTAVSPDGKTIPYTDGTNGGSGFEFNRFGVRVPAVLVSPWIEEGTICNTQFDHTSVIKTVANKWLGGQCLTKRDAAANDLSEVLSLSEPRTDYCELTPLTPPEFTGCGDLMLSDLQFDMVAAARQMLSGEHGHDVLVDLDEINTSEEATAVFDSTLEKLIAKSK